MLSLYAPGAAGVVTGGPEVLDPANPQWADPLWIDLLRPSPEEEAAVERLVGIDVPTREEMQEIEVSSRLSRQGDALLITVPVLTNSSGFNPTTTAVTFILVGRRLVTVRYDTPQGVENFVRRLLPLAPTSHGQILLGLLEAVVDRMADVLERIGHELDGVSHRIFHSPQPSRGRRRSSSREMEVLLRTIGRNGDLASKARETIVGVRRAVAYLGGAEPALAVGDAHSRLTVIGGDVQSLSEYADFLNTKTGFLLDATLGMINIQQNNIIKLFSVVAVLFLPPTLVASWYGMNFHDMPELSWRLGYPFAMLLAAIAAVVPYWIFKRKGWM